MKRQVLLVLILAACVSLIASAHARARAASGQHSEPHSTVAAAYEYDNLGAAYRSSIAVADSFDVTYLLSTVTDFTTGGRPTLWVQGRFSEASRTCTIQVVYIYRKDPAGSSTSATNNVIKHWSETRTLTAGSALKEGSYYESQPEAFSTMGAYAIRVLVTTKPASGTVDLWAGDN